MRWSEFTNAMRPPNPMLAYGILEGDTEITDMIISALAQLCAGNVGINGANVGISSFALLMAITHLYAKCVKRFYCTQNAA